jgi:pyruvate dehydrogenase E2 component (dihydrolipoamide acetyltransferase)
MMAMAALVTRSMQTIPHFYMTRDMDVAAAECWRENWNAAHPELAATFNDIFVRAASKALRDTPRMNVSFQDGRFEPRSGAGVLMVAAIDAGLTLVPLADPGISAWEEFLHGMRKALTKVKEGRATELPGGASPVLAISNLGMFRVRQFVAIIPPSCTAILAVGAIRDAPVVVNQQVALGRVASLTLSADHRVVDGITAAKFMDKIQEHLNAL